MQLETSEEEKDVLRAGDMRFVWIDRLQDSWARSTNVVSEVIVLI
jgi:hypothetical protein